MNWIELRRFDESIKKRFESGVFVGFRAEDALLLSGSDKPNSDEDLILTVKAITYDSAHQWTKRVHIGFG